MVSKGNNSVSLSDLKVSDSQIVNYYLGVTEIPCVIKSPLRKDDRPSFGLYSSDGVRVRYTDLATKDRGGVFDLLSKMWGTDFKTTLNRVYNDMKQFQGSARIQQYTPCAVTTYHKYSSDTQLECKVRDWKDYDIEYWKQFGISLEWLKYAEVYPISHKIILKNNHRMVLPADKLAYAYVERKEGKVTLKIYQPLNKEHYKWSNKHDRSVISLWTKIPEEGKAVCICSSLKDALCLWANTGIPSIALQGEGYGISNTAVSELKRRFKRVFILLDNDAPGLADAEKLAAETGFENIILPQFDGGKDISDYYHTLQDPKLFKQNIIKLFKND